MKWWHMRAMQCVGAITVWPLIFSTMNDGKISSFEWGAITMGTMVFGYEAILLYCKDRWP